MVLGFSFFLLLLLISSAWRNAGRTEIQRPGWSSLSQPTVPGNDDGRLLQRTNNFAFQYAHKSTTGRTVSYVFRKSGSCLLTQTQFLLGRRVVVHYAWRAQQVYVRKPLPHPRAIFNSPIRHIHRDTQFNSVFIVCTKTVNANPCIEGVRIGRRPKASLSGWTRSRRLTGASSLSCEISIYIVALTQKGGHAEARPSEASFGHSDEQLTDSFTFMDRSRQSLTGR